MKSVYITIGSVSLVLGVLGIFLPLLPTTPFLLLTSACYLRGSDRLHQWLMTHRMFGPYIHAFRSGQGIPLRSKILALLFLWLSLSYSAWMVPHAWLWIFLLIPGISVTYYLLWRVPTRKLCSNQA